MWVAARVKPNAELRAARGVEAAGIPAWFPVERFRAAAGRIVIRPLFRGYVFAEFAVAKFNPHTDIARLLEIDGIEGLLRPAGAMVGIPDRVIAALREGERLGAFGPAAHGFAAGLGPGNLVEIITGPFAGLLARVKSAKAKRRIEILVDFVHRLDVPVDTVRKLHA
jgi:transcriptional antiterminator RfaH